ncbi:cache domain-containing sensor histidine kinase [Paenibacillus humicola]|uniref:cache domain-containing sensor histidine kinase n=1 Tax=Paenibacillus humicola TaxID=3110540 RepID=UPI00237A3BA0|nr:sensor histidine kinase [Paenibacillus humicola]
MGGLYRKLLYDMKLRHKLLLSYLVLIVIPLGLFQWLASDKMSGLLEQHVHYAARHGFEQTYAFLSYKLAKMAETTDVIVVNDSVIQAMEADPKQPGVDRQLDDYTSLKQFLRALQNKDVARVALYVPEGLIYSSDHENFYPLDPNADSECLRKMNAEKMTYLWCTPSELGYETGTSDGHLYLTRYIRHSYNYLLPAARVNLEIDNATVLAILSGANVVKDSVSYLVSSDGKAVVSSNPGAASGIRLPALRAPDPDAGSASANVGDYFVLYHAVPSSQWTMVTAIPLQQIVSESAKLKYDLYMWVVVIATVAYLLAVWLAHSMTRRISQLVRRLRNIEKGGLISLSRMGGKDEIGELVQTYNLMLERIDRMNREQFKLGQEVKNAELKALQAQINPHFLYNTLDLINWMADRGMQHDIQRVVKSLSRFYKLSLNSGRDLITIRDELRHISFYMDIQNMRFEHKISFHIDVDEEAMACIIPKITLQPIVENAIYHGILERPQRTGSIRVSGTRRGRELILAVEDDGAGMDEERLSKLNGGEACVSRASGSGYGIRNVRLRIEQFFGPPYGLVYRSEPGTGTRAEIHIPAVLPGEMTES